MSLDQTRTLNHRPDQPVCITGIKRGFAWLVFTRGFFAPPNEPIMANETRSEHR